MRNSTLPVATLILALLVNTSIAQRINDHVTLNGDQITFSTGTTDADMEIFDTHPEIKSISLGSNEPGDGINPQATPVAITNAGFAHLANCKKLEQLSVSFVHPLQVTDDGLKALEQLTELRSIEFGNQSIFTDAALTHLANLKKLRMLGLYRVPITDAGIAQLKNLTALEDLQLGNTHIGDPSMQIFATFPNLKSIDLQYTHITDDGLLLLKPLHLTWLCINNTAITTRGLAAIAAMKDMQNLFCDDTQIDDHALDFIGNLTKLESLHLSRTKITNAGLAKLTNLQSLTWLNLNDLPITNDALPSILVLKKLSSIEINKTQITPAGIQRLEDAGIKFVNRMN